MGYNFNKNTTSIQKAIDCSTLGSFVPSYFHRIITTPSGRPDSTAINLLSEIVYLHKPSKFGYDKKFSGDLLNLRYSDLESKFNKSHESIRRAFVKLESLGLIKRSYQKISSKNTTCSNALFIEFNQKRYQELVNKVTLLNTKMAIEEKNFCSLHKNEDSSPQKCGDIYREKRESNKEANSYGLSFFSFRFGEELYSTSTNSYNLSWNILNKDVNLENEARTDKHYVQIDEPFILSDKTEETLKRDETLLESCSNFVEQDSLPHALNQSSNHQNLEIWSFDDYKKLPATEFLPLTTEFCNLIRLKTGRDFPDGYFEDVVVKLISGDESKRGDKQTLLKWSKKHLFTRLVAWTMRELKDMSQILFEFGIKSGLELEEIKSLEKEERRESLEEEKMISRYESSLDTSPTGTLKRKIAGSLPREEAAVLLTNTSFSIDSETKQIIAKITSWNKRTEKLLCVSDKIDNSRKLMLQQSLQNVAGSLLGQGARALLICDFERNSPGAGAKQSIITYSNNEFYRKIQESLYKKFGEGIYRSWFSKLEFYRVRSQHSLVLPEETIYAVAPTKFMSDWVNNNYLAVMEESIREISVAESLDIKSLTTEEFKRKLLGSTENYGDNDGLEIIDSSAIMYDIQESRIEGVINCSNMDDLKVCIAS
jgi:hypothetical protein